MPLVISGVSDAGFVAWVKTHAFIRGSITYDPNHTLFKPNPLTQNDVQAHLWQQVGTWPGTNKPKLNQVNVTAPGTPVGDHYEYAMNVPSAWLGAGAAPLWLFGDWLVPYPPTSPYWRIGIGPNGWSNPLPNLSGGQVLEGRDLVIEQYAGPPPGT
jgi:hypothetical protein